VDGGLLQGCVAKDADCECSSKLPFDFPTSGVFEVQGNSVTITGSDGSTPSFLYCRVGGRLRMKGTYMSTLVRVYDFMLDP
jgi:hypothetical protein